MKEKKKTAATSYLYLTYQLLLLFAGDSILKCKNVILMVSYSLCPFENRMHVMKQQACHESQAKAKGRHCKNTHPYEKVHSFSACLQFRI